MGLNRNLIIMIGHGLRSDALSDSQAWPLLTPNLQNLSGQGLRAMGISACPADDGGMLSLLTALHPRQHGFVNPTNLNGDTNDGLLQCHGGWPTQLNEAGYHLAGVGCVGPFASVLHDSVMVEPVDSLESSSCAYLTYMKSKGRGPAIQKQRRQRQRYGPFEPERLLMEPDDDVDGFIAVEACRMLQKMPDDKPWALVVVFSGPGNDLPPPTLYAYVVDPTSLEHGFTPTDFVTMDAMAELDYPRVMLQRLDPSKVGTIRADYLGRVSLIDHGIGRIMDMARSRADRENTWTVVSSDRGQLLAEHGLVGHRSFLNGAVQVPVIICPPSPPDQPLSRFQTPVSTVDVAATITALGGCDIPRASVGRSLIPLLAGDTIDPVADRPIGLISEFGGRLMLLTERHKLVFDVESHKPLGLYDLNHDPDEQTNLIDDKHDQAGELLNKLQVRVGETLMPLRAVPNQPHPH